MRKQYKVVIVGIGAVGTEMIRLLKKRKFPTDDILILARSDREEVIDGDTYTVRTASPEAFAGRDFAFFAGTEGAKGASQTLGWAAAEQGCVVIDNGDDFRMDDRVPLVIPEINPEALKSHNNFIANPNCSTIIALMALGPLHRAAGMKKLVACTYQAVSGSGAGAIRELEAQAHAWAEGGEAVCEAYPHPIAFNVLPKIGGVKDASGQTSEEMKMQRESRKILGDDRIVVSSTCARVPVINAHSEALHAEFEKALTVEQAREVLAAAEGVTVVDDVNNDLYPMPLDADGEYEVLVGRIRPDPVFENGLALFVAGDNIWKGAALNAIQIAEKLIELS